MFKNYAIIKDGVVLEYPVDPRTWVVSANDYNIHEYWEGGELNGKTYAFCHNMEPICAYDESLVETTPAVNPKNGLWYRQYNIVKLDKEIVAQRKQIAQIGAEEELARFLLELDNMAQLISELDIVEQTKWQKYRDDLMSMSNHPQYPFNYNPPFRPDYLQDLKIKVIRI